MSKGSIQGHPKVWLIRTAQAIGDLDHCVKESITLSITSRNPVSFRSPAQPQPMERGCVRRTSRSDWGGTRLWTSARAPGRFGHAAAGAPHTAAVRKSSPTATILADTDSNACDETRSHSHIAPTQGGCAFLRASVRKLNPETCIFDCSRAMEKRNCVESRCFDCMIHFKSQFLGPGNFYITFNHEDPITHLPDSDHSWSYSIGSRPLLRPNQRVEAIVQRQRHEGLGTGWTREV